MMLVGWQERHPAHRNLSFKGPCGIVMVINVSGQYPVFVRDFGLSCEDTRVRMTGDWESWGQLASPGLPGKWPL